MVRRVRVRSAPAALPSARPVLTLAVPTRVWPQPPWQVFLLNGVGSRASGLGVLGGSLLGRERCWHVT